MARGNVERALRAVTRRLRACRDELAVVTQQLAALADDADDDRVRALVSDDRLAQRAHRSSQRQADAMARSRDTLLATIAELEQQQSDLLARLVPEPG